MSATSDPVAAAGARDRWRSVLDDFEQVLALQRALVARSALGDQLDPDIDLVEFVPPVDMPPLPVELADRMLGLGRQNAALVDEVRRRIEEVRPAIAARMPRPTGGSPASVFDGRA